LPARPNQTFHRALRGFIALRSVNSNVKLLYRKMQRSNFINFKDSDLDKTIYRIISIERLIQLYKNNENTLVKPDAWDDPYENLILKSKVKQLSGEIISYGFHTHFYGQCWTLHQASDAMWRIYSNDKKGVRIRTTVRKLANSLSGSDVKLPDAKCFIGKVRYLPNKKLIAFSNSVYSVYEDGSLAVANLFDSLLVKRTAFSHEKEVRLLYGDLTSDTSSMLFTYRFDPHETIDQFMLDPRLTYSEYIECKSHIKSETGAKCEIKRSLLYAAPEKVVLNVKKA